jgi:hypothetical protein
LEVLTTFAGDNGFPPWRSLALMSDPRFSSAVATAVQDSQFHEGDFRDDQCMDSQRL